MIHQKGTIRGEKKRFKRYMKRCRRCNKIHYTNNKGIRICVHCRLQPNPYSNAKKDNRSTLKYIEDQLRKSKKKKDLYEIKKERFNFLKKRYSHLSVRERRCNICNKIYSTYAKRVFGDHKKCWECTGKMGRQASLSLPDLENV